MYFTPWLDLYINEVLYANGIKMGHFRVMQIFPVMFDLSFSQLYLEIF